MRYTILGIVAILAIAVMSAVAFAQAPAEKPMPAAPAEKPMPAAPAEKKAEMAPAAVGPQENFKLAKEAYIKKDHKASADEIRKGAAMLKKDEAAATGAKKKALAASVIELDKLAADMEKGKVASVKRLDDVFARADRAVAMKETPAPKKAPATKAPAAK